MAKLSGILATTNVDLHNEQMTVGALQSIVDTVNESYISFGIDHDPRIPPVGRVIKAWLETQSDGSTAVKAEIELFDGEIDSSPHDDRAIHTKSFRTDRLVISFDRNFRDTDDQEVLTNLATGLNAKLEEEVKKALDPLSVLAIGGAFAFGAISTGFLGKIGEDGYELLKESIKKLFSKPKSGEKDRLLVLEFEVTLRSERFIVEVIASNPNPQQIESLLSIELARLDELVAAIFLPNSGLKKLVFQVDDMG